MPGGGLTAIGLAGIVLSYAGIAHTFVDGLHALTGLLFFFGLIFLGAGILDGGVSTSNRTKATVLVVIAIILGFGAAAFIGNESTTLPTVAGLLVMVTIPGIVIAYMAMKMPQYVKPVGLIFIFAIGLGITVFFGFGILGPTGYLLPEVVEEAVEEIVQEVPTGKIFAISILAGSAEQGNPDYDPDVGTAVSSRTQTPSSRCVPVPHCSASSSSETSIISSITSSGSEKIKVKVVDAFLSEP